MGRFRTIALMLLYWTSDRETLSCATGSGADQSRARGGVHALTSVIIKGREVEGQCSNCRYKHFSVTLLSVDLTREDKCIKF